jgi:predicted ArsR family transcriptional regulator
VYMSRASSVVGVVGATDDTGAESTRSRILDLIATDGPITAIELAADLGLTAAGVRRHLMLLEDAGAIAEHAAPGPVEVRRGRPARAYVVTAGGQAALHDGYAEIAVTALHHLRLAAGNQAVATFAEDRCAEMATRLQPHLTAPDLPSRAVQLAAALTGEGYAATLRPVAVHTAVPVAQLCLGHCPIQDVAHEFPELCEAETRTIAELLGTHVQPLATIAAGAHACVTNLPLSTKGTR